MQILDGKNHQHGVYEKFILIRITEVLRTGKKWGFLDHPLVMGDFPPDAITRANAIFLETLRKLVDQWIDSGLDEYGMETPSARYVREVPKGYKQSLFDILLGWLSRNMPKPAMMNDGRIGIQETRPYPHGIDAETYARETAIYFLKELLDATDRDRFSRCNNSECRTYFLRKRIHKGTIKRGSYCGKCQLIGGAERTRISRQRRKDEQLRAAAEAWKSWNRTSRYPRQHEWVVAHVNRQFKNWQPIKAKWVTQNLTQIRKLS